MNCSKYKNQSNELKQIVDKLINNKIDFNIEKINALSCLLCQNFDKKILPNILSNLEKHVAENQYSSIHWYALARINQMVTNNTRAEEAYLKAINLDALNTDYLEYIARFYMSINNWQKSLEFCNRFIGLLPQKQIIANNIILSAFYNCKMYSEAIQNFELGIDLSDLQAIYKAMYSYISLNRPEKVIELIDKITLSNDDESYAVIDLIAQAYSSLKIYDKALVNYLKLSSNDYKKYRNDIAATYSNMNDFERSLPLFEKILTEKPNDINALANYALTILKIDYSKNFDKAVDCYQKVIKIDLKNLNAFNMLGMLHYKKRKYSLAYKYYLELFKLSPDSEWVVRQLISCTAGDLTLGGNVQEISENGIKLFFELKSSFKMTSDDYITASIFYKNLKLYKEAIEQVLMAIEIEPTNAHYLFSAAITFKTICDSQNACKHIEKALLIDKNNIDYLILYADVLFLLGRKLKSEKIYKKIIDIKENSDTLNSLGWFYCEQKEYEKAIPILEKALREKIKNRELDDTFVHKLKNNLAYAYIMNDKANELIKLMESSEFKDLYNDEFSNGIKTIIYLKIGDTKKADTCIPLVLTSFFPKNFDLLFKAFSAFNFKNDNWHEICIDCLKGIDINTPQYIVFKEDICRCLGYAYREKKDGNLALSYFQQACEIGKSNSVNWYELGLERLYSSIKDNDKKEAFIAFETSYKCENGKDIKPLRYLMGKISTHTNLTHIDKANLMLEFFKLASKINELKQQLIYTDSNPVYHFTRLSVLKELIKPNSKLRVNNAAHMNDPEEGKAIFRKIFIDYKTEDELEKLEPPNIFLSSFCLTGDILPLWNEYGDRSKGCSLEIQHDFFDKVDNDFYEKSSITNTGKSSLTEQFNFSTIKFIKNQISDISEFVTETVSKIENTENSVFTGITNQCQQILESIYLDKEINFIEKLFDLSKPRNDKERYCLYLVVYVNENGEIVNLSKKKEGIQNLLKQIDEILKNLKINDYREEVKHILRDISFDLLSEIQYLFKKDSYSYEQEVRIVKSRLISDMDIKEWAPDNYSIPNLYLDIDRKLHFSRCTLGPKVEHPSNLTPYLYKNNVIDKIEVSKIQYR